MSLKPSIVFMGTPDFAKASLEALYQEGYPILAVFSQPDRPKDRGQKLQASSVSQWALEKNIPLYRPQKIKDEKSILILEKLKPDFIVVAAYGQFLPERVIKASQLETINVHASLLPQYRGAAPINWSIINGDKKTGISIMRIIKQMDAGPVFSQKSIPIENDETTQTLTEKLAQLGGQLLIETLPQIISKKIKPVDQNENEKSLAPLLKKSDALINWSESAEKIFNKIRGFNPWPLAYAFIDNQLLKIYSSSLLNEDADFPCGTVYLLSPKGWHVRCGEKSLLISEVQLEGKKRMKAFDLANGLRLKTPIRLGN